MNVSSQPYWRLLWALLCSWVIAAIFSTKIKTVYWTFDTLWPFHCDPQPVSKTESYHREYTSLFAYSHQKVSLGVPRNASNRFFLDHWNSLVVLRAHDLYAVVRLSGGGKQRIWERRDFDALDYVLRHFFPRHRGHFRCVKYDYLGSHGCGNDQAVGQAPVGRKQRLCIAVKAQDGLENNNKYWAFSSLQCQQTPRYFTLYDVMLNMWITPFFSAIWKQKSQFQNWHLH